MKKGVSEKASPVYKGFGFSMWNLRNNLLTNTSAFTN